MRLTSGDPLPEFSAKDTDGNEISNTTLAGRPSVLYFMAGAGAGCTTQACAIRDAGADFNALDATVIAVSARDDGAAFKAANSLNYPVVNDPSGELQKNFGVQGNLFGLIPGRGTVVVTPEGKVDKVYQAQMSFAEHVRVAKEAIEQMKK